jgi:hypothetical protein
MTRGERNYKWDLSVIVSTIGRSGRENRYSMVVAGFADMLEEFQERLRIR